MNEVAEKTYGKKLSNIVFMGMGEPLLNYKNVLKAIERITSNDGMAMSAKRITVSTAGVAKMIRQLGDDSVKFNLALSLMLPMMKKEMRSCRLMKPIISRHYFVSLLSFAACKESARLNLTRSSPSCLIILPTPAVETVILFGLIPY